MKKTIILKGKDIVDYSLKAFENRKSPIDQLNGAREVYAEGYPNQFLDIVYHIRPEEVTLLCSNIPASLLTDDNRRRISIELHGESKSINGLLKRLNLSKYL